MALTAGGPDAVAKSGKRGPVGGQLTLTLTFTLGTCHRMTVLTLYEHNSVLSPWSEGRLDFFRHLILCAPNLLNTYTLKHRGEFEEFINCKNDYKVSAGKEKD